MTFFRTARLYGLGMAIAALLAAAGCAANRASALQADTPYIEISIIDTLSAINIDSLAAVQARLASERKFDESERLRLAQDHFILARDYERRGMNDMATRLYEISYSFLPDSRFLRQTLTDIYMRAEQYAKIVALYRDDEDLADLTPEEKRTLGLAYLRTGDIVKAADMVGSLGGEQSPEEMYSLGLLYGSVGEKEKALEAFRGFFERNERGAPTGIRLVQLTIGERRLADAESLAVILRSVYPDNAQIAALLGTAKYLNRDTTAAVESFRAALKLDPRNEEALRTLAHISVVRERYDEAIALYRRLTAQGETGAPYRRGLAFLFFHIRDYRAAEKLLDTLISEGSHQNPAGLQELHIYRGLIYSHTKRKDKAIEEFRRAVAADPQNEDAWRELCYVYILEKDRENAFTIVEQYQTAFPNSGSAWRFRGYALNMMERREEAVAALKRALEIDSADYFSWFELGGTLERLKRVDEAADAFKAALRIRPRDAQTSNYLGYMWAEAGINLDSAKTLIEDALEAEPDNGAYLDSYAWVFYQMGDYEKALHYMLEALKREDVQDDPTPYEHLGDIHFKLRDYHAAEAAYKRAIELKTEDAKRINGRLAEINKLIREKRR